MISHRRDGVSLSKEAGIPYFTREFMQLEPGYRDEYRYASL